MFLAKRGDFVARGDIICKIYGNDVKKTEKALEEVENAVKIGNEKPLKDALIKKIIR